MGARRRRDAVIIEKNGCCRGTLSAAFEQEIRIGADTQCDVIFAREIAVIELLSVNDDFLSAESLIMFRVEDICDSARNMLVIVAIQQLLDFLRTHEESLEARNDGKVAKHTSWFGEGIEARFVAVFTFSEVGIFPGICHT
jgi:hypothetical protein